MRTLSYGINCGLRPRGPVHFRASAPGTARPCPLSKVAITRASPKHFGAPQQLPQKPKRDVQTHFAPDKVATSNSAFQLRCGSIVKVDVARTPTGALSLQINVSGVEAGSLLLHWGVTGGKDYQGGWRLPGKECWPKGTAQFKDNALQSPFTVADGAEGESDELSLTISLPAEEASDQLCFVLHDESTNRWWDCNGSNFNVSLRLDTGYGASPAHATMLPKELCDKWAWVMWDSKGRPDRAAEEAHADYEAGLKEMQSLMATGCDLEELWQVANGDLQYVEYISQHLPQQVPGEKEVEASTPPAPPTAIEGAEIKPLASEASASAAVTPFVKTVEAKVSAPRLGRFTNPFDMIKRAVSKVSTPNLSKDAAQTTTIKPLDFLVEQFALDPDTKWRRVYEIGQGSQLVVVVRHAGHDANVRVDVITDLAASSVLHWGVMQHGKRNWSMPSEELWPEDTNVAGHIAVENEFLDCDDDECDVEITGAKVPLQRLTIYFPPDHTLGALTFVVRSKDHTMWYKDASSNFLVPLPSMHRPHIDMAVLDPCAAFSDDLSKIIVECEVKHDMWTLMHRYNKASDLINEALNGHFEEQMDMSDAMARIFIWLRYSSTRHLTWQRNYNTQPRVLSAAQDRLTHTVAEAHSQLTGESREWVRLMLGTCGRGGDGQAIRDEILHIMHRNGIPETRGNWMEEWHQKLHNNTTPDDVPICEAYLAFLESDGNRDAYWRVLSDNGITRQRLADFDRPITLEPEMYWDKKGALINDFRHYLHILKSVHSGADLQASAHAAGHSVPDSARGSLGYVMSHLGDWQLLPLMEAAVEARQQMAHAVSGHRELMYLDLALEDKIRQIAERCVGSSGFGAAAFMRGLLQNLVLSSGYDDEALYCLKTWQTLPHSVQYGGHPSKEDALKAVAVVNRIRRAISEMSDRTINRIGDISRKYGRAFEVEDWAYELFAEEVVRGGPAFAVSLVISSIEPTLRNVAALGDWQVISPHEVVGVVEVVEDLMTVQDKQYKIPTVLLAERVTGEEEIPDGVVAVLTPDAPDVLSHVSVRARNMKVLFATCHDQAPLEDIRSCIGKTLHFSTTASGSVTWQEAKAAADQGAKASTSKPAAGLKISVPKWSGKWVVPLGSYKDGVVGAKSKNLQLMKSRMPEEVQVPSSVTLPFGCFEKVLELPDNKEVMSQLKKLVGKLVAKPKQGGFSGAFSSFSALISLDGGNKGSKEDDTPKATAAEMLQECRELAMKVVVPPVVRAELTKAMEAAGIPVPNSEESWLLAEQALKGVWASKYNDRAYYSMRKVGLNFDDVRMAVLVQRVVPAQYAFVIHTKNPSNNDETEVFCEMVRGLGESLVSGMVAGSAVAFKASKDALDYPEVLCYASKSEAMFVPESLIFRSDSNGEDLEGYAGAGLYESITMDETETRRIDYMDDPLVTDEGYRRELMARICKLGASIEQALGSAQDIEGVVAPDGTIIVVQTRPQV